MDPYEFERFMETSELCAKEVLDVFEPGILRKIDIFKLPIDIGKIPLEKQQIEIFSGVRDYIDASNTRNNKIIMSSVYFIEDKEIKFIYLSYSHRKFLSNNAFFSETCKELLNNLIFQYKCGNSTFYNTEYYQTILKNSAINLLNSLSEECLIIDKNRSIFTNINELSLLTYEKNKTNGLIYFFDTDELSKYVKYAFKFTKRILFNTDNLKLIRKYIELTDAKNKIGLISDTNFIYGLGIEDNDLSYFSVIYKNGYSWDLLKNQKKMFSVKNNKIFVENENLFIREFETIYQQVFSNSFDKKNMRNIEKCILSLFNENRGTILVISNMAEQIVDEQYQDLSTLINTIKLDENNIKKLSTIDGAIFIDEESNCFGFGAILDGIDTKNGNPARGSRYNSSERFYSYYKKKYLDDIKLIVFILSDDGNYNFFPQKEKWCNKLLEFISTKRCCSIIDLYKQFKSLSHSHIQSILQNAIAINFIRSFDIDGMSYFEPIIY